MLAFAVLFASAARAQTDAPLPYGCTDTGSDSYPVKVDFEVAPQEPARCHWAEITKLDPSKRNDAIAKLRTAAKEPAYLALGGFGYSRTDPGPGALVVWLPESYSGPLKLHDRIIAVAGIPIADGNAYSEFMMKIRDNKRTAIMVQRGSERMRIETRIVVPKKQELATGRLQAQYLPDDKEILVITRGVAAFRLWLPAQWVPCHINWNGDDLGEIAEAGCWAADGSGKAVKCPE